MKLSLILPVYNVEQFINKCLDSIYSQGVADELFETIVIDDGSPDNSISVVDDYKRKHNNILIIRVENGGVSRARNIGIRHATGDYVMFVDTDDILAPYSLSTVIERLDNKDMYIYRSQYQQSKKERYDWRQLFKTDTTYSGLELFKTNYVKGSVWGAAYNRSIIIKNNTFFPENIKNTEDTIFNFIFLLKAKQVEFQDVLTYFVTIRDGSASSVSASAAYNMDKTFMYVDSLRNSIKSNQELEIINYLMYLVISNAVFFAVNAKDVSYYSFVKKTRVTHYLPVKTRNGKKDIKMYLMNYLFPVYYFFRYIKYITSFQIIILL